MEKSKNSTPISTLHSDEFNLDVAETLATSFLVVVSVCKTGVKYELYQK